MKRLTAGILAHVDAGKTTLSEALLYAGGAIRRMGRVDHGNAFLDTDAIERDRGITVFAKQAVIRTPALELTLLDTPGHVDFSAEAERTLQVLDVAVLVVSGVDGVQAHTRTLWQLLVRYRVPTLLFVNKTDLPGLPRAELMDKLRTGLDSGCVDMDDPDLTEQLALCSEELMERYLAGAPLTDADLAALIGQRKAFPCYFGSALKGQGVTRLLDALERLVPEPPRLDTFAARVFKIAREGGERLTYLKVTGGVLRVKDTLSGEDWKEKVNQIRIYSGEKYELVQEAKAGTVCAVTGLEETRPGQGIGCEEASDLPVLEPVLTYRIELPDGCDVHTMLRNLRQIEEEDPQLHVVWAEETGEIHIQLMGEVQTEVLQQMVKARFGVLIGFGEGKIVYKETIKAPVEGVGHFEPLRHYAEVHLLLEPGERGSGMQFLSECSEDVLDRNWQRLILTHLEEREHKGVLTGSAVTDMRITLLTGRAHQKHTEGGDFRQATYRAVRQGLRKAESILLEPYYEFRMELPMENVGRAMSDIQRMSGSFEGPEAENGQAVLTGSAPVSEMRGYQKEFAAYTGGFGRMFCTVRGYDICHNSEEAAARIGYDPDSDVENTADSVFCAHGAGIIVPWYEVEEHMHVESGVRETPSGQELLPVSVLKPARRTIELTREELDAIYVRTPDPVKRSVSSRPVTVSAQSKDASGQSGKYTGRPGRKKGDWEEYLLVDGYNIIFAWDDLRELSETDLAAARGKLADILCDYQGYRKCTLILVFDAYKVEGNPGEVARYHNIHIVYTREAETADQYIEKTVRRISRKHEVTVATSDALEQVIILGQGARRMSAAGLKEEVELARKELREEHLGRGEGLRHYLFDHLGEEEAEEMERVRLGKNKDGSANWHA